MTDTAIAAEAQEEPTEAVVGFNAGWRIRARERQVRHEQTLVRREQQQQRRLQQEAQRLTAHSGGINADGDL